MTSAPGDDPTSEPTIVGPPSLAPEDLSGEWLLKGASTVDHEGGARPALGRYPVLARIGRGGMGVVYYGWHPRLQSEVAIKTLPRDLEERHPGLAERFVREARLAARIRSQHLVAVLDVDHDPAAGVHYLVMEYVRGQSAREWSLRSRREGRPGAAEADALDVAIAAARGLEAAHLEGIVHRDVKPDNVLIPVGEDGRARLAAAKLSDLGLARADESGQSLTGTDVSLGTPGFMAPEQARDVKRAGKPADVFGLGATLYAMLAGEPPFGGESAMQAILSTLEGRYEPIETVRPDVSRPTARLIERCLSNDPKGRFADATALREALVVCRRALDEPGQVDTSIIVERVECLLQQVERGKACPLPAARGWGRRLAAALLLVGVALGAWFLRGRASSAPDPVAPIATGNLVRLEPADGAFVADAVVFLRGAVEGPVELVESGEAIARPGRDGSFRLRLDLAEGAHDLVCVGRGADGILFEVRRRIVVDRTAPALEVDAPVEGSRTAERSVVVRGRANDASGLRLEGIGPVEASPDGAFEATVSLDAGEREIRVAAVDPAGNRSEVVRKVVCDPDPPRIVVDDESAPAVTSSATVEVSGRVEDLSVVLLSVDGRGVEVREGRFRVEVDLDAGENPIEFAAEDGLGQRSITTRTIVRDSAPPRIVLEGPDGPVDAVEPRFTIRGRVEDATAVRLRAGEEPVELTGGAFRLDLALMPGANDVRLVAVDAAGNEAVAVRRVVLDRDPPTLSVASPVSGAAVRGPEVEFAGRVDDEFPAAIVIGRTRHEVAPDGTFRVAVPVGDGETAISLKAFDRAGNASAPVDVRIRVDSGAPAVSIDALPAFYETGPLELAGEVDEDRCRVEVDGRPAKVEGRRWTAKVDASVRRVEVVARDAVGNEGREGVDLRPWLRIGPVFRVVEGRWGYVIARREGDAPVQAGDVLEVRRADRWIGKLKVEKVATGGEDGPIVSGVPAEGLDLKAFAAGDVLYRISPAE